jgi:hypothetical protein
MLDKCLKFLEVTLKKCLIPKKSILLQEFLHIKNVICWGKIVLENKTTYLQHYFDPLQ